MSAYIALYPVFAFILAVIIGRAASMLLNKEENQHLSIN